MATYPALVVALAGQLVAATLLGLDQMPPDLTPGGSGRSADPVDGLVIGIAMVLVTLVAVAHGVILARRSAGTVGRREPGG